MKTPRNPSSGRHASLCSGLLLLAGLTLAVPAHAQLCVSSNLAGLNTCRGARLAHTWYTYNEVTSTTPIGFGSGRLDYRYDYTLCKNNQYCERWKLEQGPPARWVEDTACVYKKVRDKVLETESECTLDNFQVRLQVEQCRDYVNSGYFSPFSGGILHPGAEGRVLKAMQPGNPNGGTFYPSCDADLEMVSSTHANYPGGERSLDVGIGNWSTKDVPAYDGSKVYLRNVNTSNTYRVSHTQSMRADGATRNLLWSERYSKAGDWRIAGSNLASALNHPLISPYVQAGVAAPPITHTACYSNKASAFVQGFSNPAGTGATATPANVDVTTGNTPAPNPNSVQHFIADLRSAGAALTELKSVRQCNETLNRWSQACGMVSTYAHSMGAIVTRAHGLPTGLNIGSVDNVNGGASSRNNCDPIPWVTQVGIRYLLSSVPTTGGANYVRCSAPYDMECLRGNTWVEGGGAGPRTVECNNPGDSGYQDQCRMWWCDGQPGSPATQFYSGRNDFPGKNSDQNWDYCPGESRYQAGVSACIDQYVAGTSNTTDLWSCFRNVAQLVVGAVSGGADHLLKGKEGATKHNGYEVLSGLDNLGRPSGFSFRGAYLNNAPPRYPEKPVWCGDGVCEPGKEDATSCPYDCQDPCGYGGCDAGGTGPYCGDGTCDPGEDYMSCPYDCQDPCGYGGCDGGMGY